jgi:hypothetical protein
MSIDLTGVFSVAAAVLLSIGGGAVIVFALSRWLGTVWAGRILEQERQRNQRELEILIRRRNVYSKLATSLRVFLRNTDDRNPDMRQRFLEAYDEPSVWAPDSVMNSVGALLDLIHANTVKKGSVDEQALRKAFAECMTEIRRDAGFASTTFSYRMVSF